MRKEAPANLAAVSYRPQFTITPLLLSRSGGIAVDVGEGVDAGVTSRGTIGTEETRVASQAGATAADVARPQKHDAPGNLGRHRGLQTGRAGFGQAVDPGGTRATRRYKQIRPLPSRLNG